MSVPREFILGEFTRTLDERYRVSIPAEMAEALLAGGPECILAKERPGCLSLWSAAAWYRFPRAAAAPGMVAIFGRHHVAYIETVYGDGTALLYDPNSGGRATRVHRRSLSGLHIVRPS